MPEPKRVSHFVRGDFRSGLSGRVESPANRIACIVKGTDVGHTAGARRSRCRRSQEAMLPAALRRIVENPAVGGNVDVESLVIFGHALPNLLDLRVVRAR